MTNGASTAASPHIPVLLAEVVAALAPAPELHPVEPPEAAPGPSACAIRLSELAAFTSQPALTGPGGCGAVDVVKLEAVTMPDRSRVAVVPPAMIRCPMAEAVALWVRQEVGPTALELGAALASIDNFDSYSCRGRSRIAGAKLSEHGKANALDVRAIRLANGKSYELTDPLVSKTFRERLRAATCGRFTTVLGPGSDGYHENHIHMDLAERTRGYRMCQWNVHEPPMLEYLSGVAATTTDLTPAEFRERIQREVKTFARMGHEYRQRQRTGTQEDARCDKGAGMHGWRCAHRSGRSGSVHVGILTGPSGATSRRGMPIFAIGTVVRTRIVKLG